MVRIEQNIEVWKNKLLDLGGRNRMLNYKDTKRSNLQIAKPELFDLWDSFVTSEKPLVFPAFYEYPHFFGVNISDPQGFDFSSTKPGTIGQQEQRLMFCVQTDAD